MDFLRSNTAVIVAVGPFYDKTDGVTIETALTITNERITLVAETDAGSAPTIILDNIAGATSATANDLNYISGGDNGMMQLEFAAADVNRVGRMKLSITDAANHVPVFHEYFVLPQAIFDWLTGVTVPLPADVTTWNGTAIATPTVGGVPEVDVTHFNGTAGTFASGRPEVNTSHAAGTAWNSGAIGASTLAADTLTAAKVAADVSAEIADAIWDEAMSGHVTLGTYGQWARANGLTGEINDAGATTTAFIVDGFTEATNDHFNGMILVFTSGALLGQARTITDYVGSTQTITVAEALTDTPADNDDFVIIPGPMAGGTLAQTDRLFVTLLNSSGQIQAGTLASDTLTAAKVAADVGTEIAGAVWNEDATGHQTQGTFGQAIGDPVADTNTLFKAVVTDASGATVGADTTTIIGQTDDIGVAGAGLTAIPWNAAWDAEVESEVNDAINTAISELGVAAPTATPTLRTGMMLMYMALRNKLVVQTSGTDAIEIYNDAGTKICAKTITDDGADYTEAEMA